MNELVWFSEVDKKDVNLVGGKGANLGELYSNKILVPNGFIVTSTAYFKNIRSLGVLDRIKGILYGLDIENSVQLESKAQECQREIRNLILPKTLRNNILGFYKKLSRKNNVYVAVRSSATAEDLPEASFAGQQATFLNVRGEKNLINAILDSWASLFEARAIYYRVQKGFDHFKVGIAVPVQEMVQSEVSGIMFTLDPVTNNKNVIVIEAVYGLGELIVSGQITPDHYEILKNDLTIITKTIVSQEQQLVRNNQGNKLVKISKNYRKIQKLKDEQIIELAQIGKNIEKHYYFPQDIEWAYSDNKLYIVQTRPVTTTKIKIAKNILETKSEKELIKPLLQGAPASPVIGVGKVVKINNIKELYKVEKGDVLVTEMTNPDYVPAMRKAVAIVTNRGGRTSHAAIVSRELGIACVVGTGNATKILKEGMVVTVDGAKGFVYKGQILKQSKQIDRKHESQSPTKLKTATKLYVNLAEPELAKNIAAKNIDGVGLLRAEFILAAIGIHPKEFIFRKQQSKFIQRLSDELSIFCNAFGQRPVIYRASDLKTNEYRNLTGGDKFEPVESNPMLGYRGAFRYIKDPDVFKLELEAIRLVRKNYSNLHLMIPFVRNVRELISVKELVGQLGLFDDHKLKFLMMAEIPANFILLDDFIKIGIDGISIGSNDLTMLILGTDRDNEEVASEFDELNPAVLWALEKIVKTSTKNNITCSICGQGPSIYPELTQKLVSWGITSISVNPDAIENTRELIYEAEKRLTII